MVHTAISLDLLALVTLDAYLMAHYGQEGGGIPEGRLWERAVSALLRQPGLSRHQYAGTVNLFGKDSLSGYRHEIDVGGSGWAGRLIVECKAKRGGIDKGDIAIFQMKAFDYFCGSLETARLEEWWTLLVSAGEVSEEAR